MLEVLGHKRIQLFQQRRYFLKVFLAFSCAFKQINKYVSSCRGSYFSCLRTETLNSRLGKLVSQPKLRSSKSQQQINRIGRSIELAANSLKKNSTFGTKMFQNRICMVMQFHLRFVFFFQVWNMNQPLLICELILKFVLRNALRESSQFFECE